MEIRAGRAADRDDTALDCLAGGGEMGALMRSLDWSRTRLGPVSGWPQSLRTSVSICLASRFPMVLWWGPDLVMLYNDAYRPMLGKSKHPGAMGQPGLESWPEIVDIIGPMLAGVLERGEATWSDDQMLPLVRNGYVEECYFTFSYSPIRDESGGIGGVFTAVTETTERVVGERRLRLLRALAVRSVNVETTAETCDRAARVLASSPADVPFFALYLLDPKGDTARLAATSHPFEELPPAIDLDDGASPCPLARAVHERRAQRLDGLARHLGAEVIGSAWAEPCDTALMLPVAQRGQGRPFGVLIAGVSPRRPLDDAYQGFLDLVADHLATAIASTRAYEEERRRAEALAEIDRAKTTFFSNVSHELRTPLTLMLGPIDDLLSSELSASQRDQAEMARRNGLRLLKLVNTLLDFSRVEAGRVAAAYVPTDLAAYTADVASSFRSLMERAGLRFVIDCAPLPEPVFVDHDMWEKIVLNLLSNAFKFTFEGEVALALDWTAAGPRLTVRDTGTGIPADELPHVFERFRRVQGARGRSFEGTGIGLALVKELARRHGGAVAVESALGRGTTFTVTLRAGSAHLPREQIGATMAPASASSAPFIVADAAQWIDVDSPASVPPLERSQAHARVLVVDDNADMRAYLRRLLAPRWHVEIASDGASALDEARAAPPDLVLADVMMPGLDGFGLLRELRAHPRTRTVPVILLSARAGEEARVEGLDAGADDYLVKPFSARELVARVRTHLELSGMRHRIEAERETLLGRERDARLRAEEAIRAKDEFLAVLGHELRNPLAPIVTALHLMRQRSGDALARERSVIERQVQHLTRLVDDLMDVSRIARGKVELKKKRVEMADVVAKAVEIASPLLEQRAHRLILRVPRSGHAVEGDDVRLAQVLANLLTNAAKYTERGGTIELCVRRAGESVEIVVRDTGIGIHPDLLPRVFDLFVQAQQTIDRSQGGLGLGLTIVRNLVELHGGSVAASSDGAGKGSTFVVRLPLAAITAEPSIPPPSVPAIPSALRRRVLLVDDNRDVAEVLAEWFETNGHVVRVAYDGPGALALLDDFTPEIALLDIGLPVMDGYELAARLRHRLGGHGVTIVAVTGYGLERDRARSRKAGFDAHLIKPIDDADLADIIARSPRSRTAPPPS